MHINISLHLTFKALVHCLAAFEFFPYSTTLWALTTGSYIQTKSLMGVQMIRFLLPNVIFGK